MYSRKCINIIAFILALIICFLASIICHKMDLKNVSLLGAVTKESVETKTQETTNTKQNNEENKEIEQKNEQNSEEKNIENNTVEENWQIEIPAISLTAKISEGTDAETLNEFVGHFSITQKIQGNIGLAAHNRGYPVNYFANLKNLNGGEEIIYTYGEIQKTYIVTQNIKISDIDWSYLENTLENKLTLITCIAGEPAYRRCVQAIEKEEN